MLFRSTLYLLGFFGRVRVLVATPASFPAPESSSPPALAIGRGRLSDLRNGMSFVRMGRLQYRIDRRNHKMFDDRAHARRTPYGRAVNAGQTRPEAGIPKPKGPEEP